MAKGIIFDMDGVLVKTIHIAEEIAREKLSVYGIKLNRKDIECLAGYSWKEFLDYIYDTRKIKPVKGLYEEILSSYSAILADKVEVYGEPVKLLGKLSEKYMLALVSGSSKRHIVSNLKKFGLTKFFPVVLSSDDVKKGKPEPDLYLLAAEKLGLKPEDCIGIEDSILGVQSVKSAGMKCIAVAHTVSSEKLKEADLVTDNLKKLSSFVDKLECMKPVVVKKSISNPKHC